MIKSSSLFEKCAQITKPNIKLTHKNLDFICDVMFDGNYQLMRDSVRYSLDQANKKNHQVLVKKLTVDLATIDILIEENENIAKEDYLLSRVDFKEEKRIEKFENENY